MIERTWIRPAGRSEPGSAATLRCASTFFTAAPERITARDEARFFGALKTANNTFKRTEPMRLTQIDAALVAILAKHEATIRTALDLGISSGTTTLELLERLRRAGHPVDMTGTDRAIGARLVSLPWGCRALVEPDGHVLQYEVFGRAVRPWTRRLDSWTGMSLVRSLVKAKLRGPAAAAVTAGEGVEVALLSPRLQQSKSFQWREDDITVPNEDLAGRFDLVRAANLLNRHYFKPSALRSAVANTIRYLSGPGAWLLIVRTHGSSWHKGTLFRMTEDHRLAVIARYGGGSEVEDLVIDLSGRSA